eukprot:scaffold52978_cov17-Tisochrysis_lutea.AAC.1
MFVCFSAPIGAPSALQLSLQRISQVHVRLLPKSFPSLAHIAPVSTFRISDKGAMQLSIDCDAVLRALLEFPRLASAAKQQPGSEHDADLQALAGTPTDEDADDGESNPFAPYSVYVQREMGTLNNMMK